MKSVKSLMGWALVAAMLSSLPVWAKGSQRVLSGTVNVNTASPQELMLLPGVGAKTAEEIISARPFKGPEELTRVKGIGPKKLAKMQAYLTVEGPTTAKLVSTSEKGAPAKVQ